MKKNVLLITSDQQHWMTLGFLNPEIQTPNLDRLAAEGTAFLRAYCPNPTCTPTRASIITGQYPSQHGAYSLGTKLMEDVPTVGEDFQKAGYRTALIGKAHFQPLKSTEEYPSLEAYPVLQDLDFWRRYEGPFYGFEHFELARNHTDEAHVGQHYALWMEEQGLTDWRRYFRKPTGERDVQRGSWDLPEEYHYNTWIAERTGAHLEQAREKDEPFFIWASFFDPHPGYLVPEPWASMYDPESLTVPEGFPEEHRLNPPHFQKTQEESPDFEYLKEPEGNGCHGCHSHLQSREEKARNMAIYYGMVSCMDRAIGRILDRLDELGLRDETLVAFTTDHGHFFGQHGLVAKGPFHYEDMVKIPLIVRMPGNGPVGRTSDALQSLVDLAPTFLDVCGLPVPRRMTGVSQKDVWSGETESARDCVLVENRHQPTRLNLRTRIDRRWKITVYYDAEYGEIFDLENDPEERQNLWDDPSAADLKRQLLLRFMQAEMGREPLPMPRITFA